jgi:predicted transglutaminase-like cysteine proteinase
MRRRHSRSRLAKIAAAAAVNIFCLWVPAYSATPATANAIAPLNVFARAVSVDVSQVLAWGPMYSRYQKTWKTDALWQDLIGQARAVSSANLIEHVNKLLNRVIYRPDVAVWGEADYWATPSELLRRGGDCEDYAIAKFLTLRELGIPSEQMQIFVLRAEPGSSAHALLVVDTTSGPFVLDNLRSDVYRLTFRLISRVAFSFNDTNMWVPLHPNVAALSQ